MKKQDTATAEDHFSKLVILVHSKKRGLCIVNRPVNFQPSTNNVYVGFYVTRSVAAV
jgi:hypothetical protein